MTTILVISEHYWPGDGGELATHLIVNMLSKKFDIIVITGTENPAKLPKVAYIYEPLLSKQEKNILWLNTLRLARTQRFEGLLRESDIVYVPRFAFSIIPYAKRMKKKVVVHLHGYIPISYTATILAPYEEHKHRITRDDIELECMKGLKHCLGVNLLWWLPRLARRWISQADKVACVSRRQAEIIASQVPELKGKVEVIYNPLPPELANAEPRKDLDSVPTFLYVGGDSYIKGFHILLQALNKLGKQGFKASFILTNKYSHQSLEMLKKLSEKYSSLNIQLLGRVEYSKLKELHRKTWALLFPSIWEEPLPYAVLEASILGTIPIASAVGGVPELLGRTITQRYMVSPGSVEDLVKRVTEICSLGVNDVMVLGYKLREEMLQRLDLNRIEGRVFEIFGSTKEANA